MDLVPDGSLMKIKPVFKTFVPEEPILIEVYSEKGVTFGEFYVQAKDANTNSTVGHWRIDDERQSAYKCSGKVQVISVVWQKRPYYFGRDRPLPEM